MYFVLINSVLLNLLWFQKSGSETADLSVLFTDIVCAGFAGQKQQRAVVYVDGNINADDHLTLSVTTAYASKTVRLRRVEHSVLHEQLTTFTVVGQTNGTPDLHWDTVSVGTQMLFKCVCTFWQDSPLFSALLSTLTALACDST